MPLIPALGRQRQEDFWIRGQPGLQSEFQDSQGYTDKPCLEKKKKKKKQNNNNNKTSFKWLDMAGAEYSSAVKSTDCSSRGPEFNSQQPHSGSQPSVMASDVLFCD